MTFDLTLKLGIQVYKTSIIAQKIDKSTITIYKIVILVFLI